MQDLMNSLFGGTLTVQGLLLAIATAVVGWYAKKRTNTPTEQPAVTEPAKSDTPVLDKIDLSKFPLLNAAKNIFELLLALKKQKKNTVPNTKMLQMVVDSEGKPTYQEVPLADEADDVEAEMTKLLLQKAVEVMASK